MSEAKSTRVVTVAAKAGLHARPAVALAELSRGFQAQVTLAKDGERAKSTDVLHLLSLGAAQGHEVTVEASGPEAAAALDAIEAFFAARFHEE